MLFTSPRLDSQERAVVTDVEHLRRTLDYMMRAPRRWTGVLRRVALARCIQGSNSIEGFEVSLDDAIAAAEGEEPLDAETETVAAIMGYRRAMTYVLQLAGDPHFSFNDGLIRALHFMMLEYRLAKHPGRWRPGSIYVRNDERQEIVYEAPSIVDVPDLMEELITWLNISWTENTLPVLVRGAMAHLNLVMIHPFSDGNGRMARCLQTLVLAQEGILAPEFCSVEEYLGANTQDYYGVLGEVGSANWNPAGDTRPWVRFMLTAHYRQAQTLLRRTREIERLWNALEKEIASLGLPDRVLAALSDASMGFRVRNATYRAAAELSYDVAGRDLSLLAERGLLIAHGERRGRFYVASDRIKQLRLATREPKRVIEDPFTVQPDQRTLALFPGR